MQLRRMGHAQCRQTCWGPYAPLVSFAPAHGPYSCWTSHASLGAGPLRAAPAHLFMNSANCSVRCSHMGLWVALKRASRA